jgi:hypothetical protein
VKKLFCKFAHYLLNTSQRGCRSTLLSICLFFHLSVCLFIYLSFHLSICLSIFRICLSIYQQNISKVELTVQQFKIQIYLNCLNYFNYLGWSCIFLILGCSYELSILIIQKIANAMHYTIGKHYPQTPKKWSSISKWM